MSIITSLLDTDFYKLTMMQAGYHLFPDTEVEYEFKCRNNNNLSVFTDKIRKEIDSLCSLKFKPEEIGYLKTLNLFQDDFLNSLVDFNLNFDHVKLREEPFSLRITGSWFLTILFETPVLSIISEIYLKKGTANFTGNTRLGDKINLIKNEDIRFADFGTRRRFSFDWHMRVVGELKNELPNQFIGTSNVLFAMKYNLKPIGTMAHEWLQAGQALAPSLRQSQAFMLRKWLDEYKGELAIALTDVIGMDVFLRDFEIDYLGLSYSGCRQDSGDPFIWGKKLIAFYKRWGIDPKSRTAVFSDGLTFPKMIKINNHFKDSINCVFGIGTNLTNDVGIDPLQIVIKMTKCNGKPVAKISDSPGKGMCKDEEFLKKLRTTFNFNKKGES